MTRVLLRDLLPGQDYEMKFRTNNGMNVSEWSPVYTFSTDGDVTPPGSPSDLTWEPTGESFIATWTPPTQDSNGKPLRDLKDYEVTVEANGKTKVYNTVDTTFDFTLVMNAQAFGGIELTVKITVKARDHSGNRSAGISLEATEDTPPIPSVPIISTSMGQITVEWDGGTSIGVINAFNLQYVGIHASTVNNFTPNESTLVGRFEGWLGGSQRTIVTGLEYGTVYYFKLVSVNKKGKPSDPSAQATGTPTRLSGLDIENFQIEPGQINFTARELGGANAFYGTTLPTGTAASDGTAYKAGDIFYNVAAPPTLNAGKTYRRNAAGTWVEDPNIGVISGKKILTNTLTADAVGTNLLITSSANIGNAVIDDAKIASLNAAKIVANETSTNVIVANTAQIKDAIISSAKIINLSANKITTGSLQADQKIIAGPATGDHAEMSDKGFRVYTSDPITNIPNEVIRMGTDTNDFFAVVNAAGNQVASIDDNGTASFKNMFTDRLYVAGQPMERMLTGVSRGQVGRFSAKPGFDMGGIYNPCGVAEVGAILEKGRMYRIDFRVSFWADTAGDEAIFRLIWSQGNDGDTVSNPPSLTADSSFEIARWYETGYLQNRLKVVTGTVQFSPLVTSRHKIGLSMQRGPAGSPFGLLTLANDTTELLITDLGNTTENTGGFNNMGGQLAGGSPVPPPPPPATQNYFVDLAPAGWTALRGDGSVRTDVAGPVQGYDPSGFNGDSRGHWWFNMPVITGYITRIDFFCHALHWYYNSGGTPIFNIACGNIPYAKPVGDWHVPGHPKPGGRELTLPQDWYGFFRTGGAFGFPQANGITVGWAGNNNPIFYGRFDGGSARLRIHWTQ